MERVNILGVGVHNISLEQAVAKIEGFVVSGTRHYVCVTNVHTVMMSQRDEEYRTVQNGASLVVPDGQPLVWVQRLMGYDQHARVYGPDLMLASLEHSVTTGTSHFFYGGKEGTPELLAEKMTARFPGLKVLGCYSPPFRPPTPEEAEAEVQRINESGADIIWVGLGAPKQELWMGRHVGRIKAPVMVGVGAAFDFHTGQVKQAPNWMQRHGLEWLFRLWVEPRRLWRRYLYNNPLFVLLVLAQLTRLRKCELPD